MNDDLLLTPEEISKEIGHFPHTKRAQFDNYEYELTIAKAQLAKAKPIIEKQERERTR